MGKRSRPKPQRLADKLLTIRQKLGLSQNELIRRLGLQDELAQDYISKYERGALEPPLYVLCAYADAANVTLDCLARDGLDLPGRIPAPRRSVGATHARS
jgi:transcriptional regulator with XRE-family HTH domain